MPCSACRAACLGTLLSLVGALTLDTNLTVYHLNPRSVGAMPLNMNTGDERGDLNFFLPQFFLPLACSDPDSRARFDCGNPERTDPDLVVTKVDIVVDSQYTEYSECNLCTGRDPFTGDTCINGTYVCDCGYGHDVQCNATRVGRESASGQYHCRNTSEAWDCWGDNIDKVTGGYWYSTLEAGQCKNTTAPGNCSWKAVSMVTVKAQCITDAISTAVEHAGPSCFDSCSKPQWPHHLRLSSSLVERNMSSSCWINCFFETLLGSGSSSSAPPEGQGMAIGDIVTVWKSAFLPVSEGGCPRTETPVITIV